jgi:hypothetical protein
VDLTKPMSRVSVPSSWRPKPEDEFPHEPFGDPKLPWKDTWYLAVRDEASNANMNMHMTISANRSPSTRTAVGVAQGNRRFNTVIRTDGITRGRVLGNEAAHLEVLHSSWDSDHELRWTVSLPEVEWELTLHGAHFAPLWDAMFPGYYATGKSDGQFYGHAEQVITAEGTMRWADGEPIAITGSGWRDRGWGRRKTQLMFNSAWDVVGAVLPDGGVFSLTTVKSHELSADAPTPVAGWRSDERALSPLVRGSYHKEATAFPLHLDLEFLDGYKVCASQVSKTGILPSSMQEAEIGPESPGLGAAVWDLCAIFADEAGRHFPVYTNHGYIHKVDALRHTDVRYDLPPEEDR